MSRRYSGDAALQQAAREAHSPEMSKMTLVEIAKVKAGEMKWPC
jgi:hypothetical protein